MPQAQDDSQDVLVPREARMPGAAAQERRVICNWLYVTNHQLPGSPHLLQIINVLNQLNTEFFYCITL